MSQRKTALANYDGNDLEPDTPNFEIEQNLGRLSPRGTSPRNLSPRRFRTKRTSPRGKNNAAYVVKQLSKLQDIADLDLEDV